MTEEDSKPQKETVDSNEPTEMTRVTDEEQSIGVVQDSSNGDVPEKTVPLSAHLKERKKRQTLQEERDYYKKMAEQKSTPPTEEDDYSKFESVTREDLGKNQFETIRMVREGDWSENYPERMAIVEAELEDFLKQRPNLGPAINTAPNRYKEAWDLMQALSPRSKNSSRSAPQKEAPNSPGTVPKAAALNETLDVMNMTDREYRDWAKSKRKRR